MRIYEGSILTCDRQNHVYQYLVENNGVSKEYADTVMEVITQYMI